MNRWKMKVGLTDGQKGDRELTLIIACYGDDNLPIERHVISIPENATATEFSEILAELARKIGT